MIRAAKDAVRIVAGSLVLHLSLGAAAGFIWSMREPLVARGLMSGDALKDTIIGLAMLAALALVLFFVSTAVLAIFVAPYRVYRAERDRALAAEKQVEELERAAALVADELPRDWRMRDLFPHLDPDILEDTRSAAAEDDRWEMVEIIILNKLAAGRLRCWGRPLDRNIQASLGRLPRSRSL